MKGNADGDFYTPAKGFTLNGLWGRSVPRRNVLRKKPYQRKAGGKYYIDFYEVAASGDKIRRTKSTGTTDFSVAKQILKEKQSLAALGKFSMPVPASSISVAEAIGRYCKFTRSKSVSPVWEQAIERAVTECFSLSSSVRYASQIKAEHIETYISWLIEQGFADSTREKRERVIRKFVDWLCSRDIIARDPFRGVEKLTRKPQPSMLRRMILPEEMDWIHRTLETVKDKTHAQRRTRPKERLACYLLAIRTGFRSSEIAALRVSDFHLEDKQPKVVLGGRFTKTKERAIQFLDDKIAKRMLEHFSEHGLKSSDAAFNLPRRQQRSEMLRRDFQNARKLWKESKSRSMCEDFLQTRNTRGEVINFHCLRHTCGAWLAHAGTHPKTIQSIMRHKSIKLTMDTYGHLFPDVEAEAIARTAFFSDEERSKGF